MGPEIPGIQSEQEIENMASDAYLAWKSHVESTPEVKKLVEIRHLLATSALDGIRQRYDGETNRKYHNSKHTIEALARLEKIIREHNLSQFRKIERSGSQKKQNAARSNLIGPIEENLMYIAMAWHDYVQADLSKIHHLPVGSPASQVTIPIVISEGNYEARSFESLKAELEDTGLISESFFGTDSGDDSNETGLEFLEQLILGTRLVRIELDNEEEDFDSQDIRPKNTGAIPRSLAGILIDNSGNRINKRQFMLGLFALADIGSYLEDNLSPSENIMRDVLNLLSEQKPGMLDCLRGLIDSYPDNMNDNINNARAALFSIANFLAGQKEWIINLNKVAEKLLPKTYYQQLKAYLDSLLVEAEELQNGFIEVKGQSREGFIKLISESKQAVSETIKIVLSRFFGIISSGDNLN